MNDLVILENLNAVEVFGGEGLDDLLQKITDEARGLIPDTSTNKGRKEIASIAAKVAKSKTYLDGLGKDLVSDWKTKAKAVDGERKKMRDYLDGLKADVRKPLTEWEEAEAERELKHQNAINHMREQGELCSTGWAEKNSPSMRITLKAMEAVPIDIFEEYAPEAARIKDKAVTDIREAIAKREAYDKEQAELEKLRAEAAVREKLEAEERLRKEGEERARIEAERKAKAESESKEKELQQAELARQSAIKAKEDAQRKAIEAEEQAKSDAIEAKAKADIEIEQAAQRERDRIEQERIESEKAEKVREADKKHRGAVNTAAAKAIKDVLNAYDSGERSLTIGQAKLIVTAIAKGQIPHVKIGY